MSDEPSHDTDDFQLSGLKRTITGSNSSPQSSQRADDGLRESFSREDATIKKTQYIMLQLVSMVRENSILYDEEIQSAIPEAQLKRQKREAWDRIRADIMWQDMTPVQDVWSDLLEQYSRKSEELSDNLLEAMRWTDSIISKKKVDSRPPSEMNNMSSSLDKDFFGDVPLAEDVLVSSQSIDSPPSSLNMIRDYVVIQPSRRIGDIDGDHSRPSSSSNSHYSRRKSPEPRETEAVVRTYPLPSKGGSLNSRSNNVHARELKITKIPIREALIKKEYKEEIPQINFSRSGGVLVEVEHGYSSAGQKVYKIVNAQRSNPQATATVTSGRRLIGMHRGNSFSYESGPPEQLIESPDMPTEPPAKKKMIHDELRHSRALIGASSSKMRCRESSVSIHSDPHSPDKILSDEVPIADDEIILDAEGECKPMIGPDLLLSRTSRSSAQHSSHDMGSQSMQSTSADDMHHYHHEDIEDGGVVEDIEQQVVVEQGDVMAMQSIQAIQYDEDLAFQQHINSVLNRLNDDEKALMKFNMQKIILDARFGAGTARNMVKDDEMLDAQEHVEIEPVEEEEEEESNNSDI